MTQKCLSGKVALVTGASAGIGRAAALAVANAGADVAINYLTYPESAEELAQQIQSIGRRALLCHSDIADQTAVESMVDRTVGELGRIDLLVSNAAFSDRERFYEANMTGFRRTIDVTMWGAFYCLRAVSQALIRQNQGGSIVVVSSPHAHVAIPSSMAYNMAKAAIDQMAKTAALELVKFNIRVNLVHPGWTDTPGERKYFSETVLMTASRQLPLGRLAQPEEIARGILFLLDPASEYVTGTTLSIDGGSQLPWWSKRGTGDF